MKLRWKEWALLAAVTVMSISANAPDHIFGLLGVQRSYLLIALSVIVGVALLQYLDFMFILIICVLAVGANVPEEMARMIGFQQDVMMLALIAMVTISLANKFLRLLPTGLEQGGRIQSDRSKRVLFNAIEQGNLNLVQRVLSMGVDVNLSDGYKTPLIRAIELGHAEIVKILISGGADLEAKDSGGHTVLDIALRSKHPETIRIIQTASLAAAA
ncbi:MAG: ankyrin repeat domain-containing protein [Gammaproteobacteria bacterium]|nr:ankyrin repeat domain-containing protein [Gammaproteobacteria bacterium]